MTPLIGRATRTPTHHARMGSTNRRPTSVTLDELEDAVSRGNEQALLRLIALIHRFTQTHADDEDSTETEDADETEVDAIAGDTGFSPLPEHGGEAETAKTTEVEDTTQREEAPQQQETRDWKQFYRQCLGCPDLDGRWIGDYRSHGKELVHISHRGFRVLATKITGDPSTDIDLSSRFFLPAAYPVPPLYSSSSLTMQVMPMYQRASPHGG